jgi:acetylornithine deacetylase/succinyl-diaminopimelate desuccinylase-like protein
VGEAGRLTPSPWETERVPEVHIPETELVDLALALGTIDTPAGREAPAGEFVYRWLVENQIPARKIGMLPDRFSVLGTIRGAGQGYSLIFNSHLDTSKDPDDHLSLRDPGARIHRSAWREGDTLYGDGIVNDKGPLAAFLMAAKAIRKSGTELKGDLLLSAVPGEIGLEPVDEFTSPRYLSKEVGTRFLIQHGGVADFALVAEGTDFGVAWVEAGKAFFKLTLFGDPQVYTPFLRPLPASAKHPNAILRAGALLPRLQEWACEYEGRFEHHCEGGTIVPKVCIGAIRGGNPYHVTRTSEVCYLYLDVRTVPEQDPLEIKQELAELLREAGVPGDVDLFLYRRAYEAKNPGLLVEGIRRAHRQVFGTEAQMAAPPYASMWRDVSVFNEMGIPAVTYGPPRAFERCAMRVQDLVNAARVYARIALNVCNQVKPRAPR